MPTVMMVTLVETNKRLVRRIRPGRLVCLANICIKNFNRVSSRVPPPTSLTLRVTAFQFAEQEPAELSKLTIHFADAKLPAISNRR